MLNKVTLSRKKFALGLGTLLLLSGFLVSRFSVDPKSCETAASDSRTVGELFRALSSTVPPKPDLDLAIREILAMQDGRSIGAHTQISRFYQAAYLTEGSVSVADHAGLPDSRDFNHSALSVLGALKKEFPENGIYAFFIAAVLKDQGAEGEAVRKEFHAAFQAPEIDPFVTTISRRIFEMGLTSVENHVLANTLIAQIRLPNLLKGFFALKEQVVTGDADFASSILGYCKKVIQIGNANLSKPDRVSRWSGEYAIAQNLIDVAWPKVHGSESIPPEFQYTDAQLRDLGANGSGALSSWKARLYTLRGCSALHAYELKIARADYE